MKKVSEMGTDLCHEARRLLDDAAVDYVIGFAPGSLKFTTTPLITRNKDDTANLVINRFINNNLARYLLDSRGRTAVVAKGCDSRSIVSLIQDKQVRREDVFIIGVPCQGLVDVAKVERLVGKDSDMIDDITVTDDKAVVTVDKKKKSFDLKQVLFDHCLSCEYPVPAEYDMLIENPVSDIKDLETGNHKIQDLKQMTPDQRWAFWKDQFSHCIRCYACRQVCPACFCERCFVEESQPRWISPAAQWQDNLIFQVMRSMHVAGRCTDCGECERACPQNIPLRSMMAEMCSEVDELFDYKAGMDKDASPLMTSYKMQEAEGLIR